MLHARFSNNPEVHELSLGAVAAKIIELLAADSRALAGGSGWQWLGVWSMHELLFQAQRPGPILSILDIIKLAKQNGNRISGVFPLDDQDVLRRLLLLLRMLIGYPLHERLSADPKYAPWQPNLLSEPNAVCRPVSILPPARPNSRLAALACAVQWLVGRRVEVDLSNEAGIAVTCLALEAELDNTGRYEKVFASLTAN